MSGKPVPSSTSRQSLRKPQKIVYVDVGPDKQSFGIHKDLLCEKSRYFKAAFGRGFKEAILGRVVLEKEDPEVFGFIVEWLYTSAIKEGYCAKPGMPSAEGSAGFQQVPDILTYVDIWALADYLQMPELQNHVMKAMFHGLISQEQLEQVILKPILSETLFGSALQRYFVDYCVWTNALQVDFYREPSFPKVLLSEITVGLARRLREKTKKDPSPLAMMSNYLVPESS